MNFRQKTPGFSDKLQLRTSEPDWETAATVAVKTLQSPEDYDTFISGLEKPKQLSKVEDMVNVAEKPWFSTIYIQKERFFYVAGDQGHGLHGLLTQFLSALSRPSH